MVYLLLPIKTIGIFLKKINSSCLRFLQIWLYLNPDLNKTFITFIDKVINHSLVHHFRPTSLCNVIYKVISKTLANRLKRKINKFISPS